MRTLYITEHWPWPSRSGARLRAAATVRALAELGDVNLLHLDRRWRHSWEEEGSELPTVAVSFTPDDGVIEDGDDVHPPQAAETRRAYGSQVAEWLRTHDYDLIWCNRVITWTALPRERRCPVVIDVDDLEDRLVLQGVGHEANSRSLTRHGGDVDPVVAAKGRQWRRLQEDAAADVDWLVFTSELDAARFRQDHSGVVPNVYLDTTTTQPLASSDPGPRVLLTGLFNYPPNADAARRLALDILPLVRRRLPEAHLWLVGEDIAGVLADLNEPWVRRFGQVPDVKPYVRAADVVAVPLRQGSGTRLKILEAFAMGTPVVSTGLGAEGLDLVPDEHLALGETDEELAAAIIRIMLDRGFRHALVTNAHERFRQRHTLGALLDAVGTVADRALERWKTRSAATGQRLDGARVTSPGESEVSTT